MIIWKIPVLRYPGLLLFLFHFLLVMQGVWANLQAPRSSKGSSRAYALGDEAPRVAGKENQNLKREFQVDV